MLIAIKNFAGIRPKVPARYLENGQAQTALNCPIFNGSLQPMPDVGSSVFTLPKVLTPKTIYRFGMDLESDTQYWFHWGDAVDVVRGPVAGDTSERTYFTGDSATGYPQVTNATLALTGGGANYPIASYRLGIPAPTGAPTLSSTGTGSGTAETRNYVYTWVNSWGEESAPSPVSADISWQTGQTIQLYGFAALPSGAYNITNCRIYRATAGTYLFVKQITATAAIGAAVGSPIADDVAAADLGEEIPSITWDMPPAGLSGLIALPNGILAGFSGRDIYFCDPYHPFAWPTTYMQTSDYPVAGLGRADTTLVVLTKGAPYFIQGTHPDNMAMVKSDLEQACASKRSIVSTGGAVYYASPDGLVMLAPSGSKILTDTMFTRAQWQAFKPSSIHAYQHDNKYVAFYDTGTVQGGFIYDLLTGEMITHNIYATAGYNDLLSDTLYLAFADRTVKKWYAGAAKSYVWRSKKFTMDAEASFSCAQLEAESYGMTVKIIANGTEILSKSVASRAPFRLPAVRARDWEVQIEGAYEVFSFAMSDAMMELGNA